MALDQVTFCWTISCVKEVKKTCCPALHFLVPMSATIHRMQESYVNVNNCRTLR